MFKIRDFAEIAQVSTSALRYYDEIGLFKPIHVEAETGYRFYAINQLVRLNRILALKELGLELTQIALFLDEDISLEALHGMLRLKQAKLQQHIQAEQEQLAHIEARLKYIEREGSDLSHGVVLKEVKAFTVITSRMPVADFQPCVYIYSTDAFLNRLKSKEIKPDGPLLYISSENASSVVDFDVAIAAPIDQATAGKQVELYETGVTIQHLPTVPHMASLLYHGDPHALLEAYQALGTWIGAHDDYTIAGPCRKICLRWSGDLDDYLTELQFPIEKQS